MSNEELIPETRSGIASRGAQGQPGFVSNQMATTHG